MSNDTTAEERLRALAAKATPGPWEAEVAYQDEWWWTASRVGPGFGASKPIGVAGDSGTISPDAEYIAACDPQTLTAILDALATERAARVQAAAEAAALREVLTAIAPICPWDRLGGECQTCGAADGSAHGTPCAVAAILDQPPSTAVQRVQGIVAAAERVLVEYDLLLRQQPSLATTTIPYQPYEALRAALNGNEADR